MNWTEKYRPKTISEVIGNELSKKRLVEWLNNWRFSKKLGALLIGPPGIGKTATVYALASDFGYHVIELNASDYRTANKIIEKVGFIAYENTLESYISGKTKKVLIFFDEIDGIDPKEDRGGLDAVIKISSKKAVPVIASANFIDPIKHKILLDNFEVIEFRKLTPKQIYIIIKRISELEKLDLDDDTLIEISRRSMGDARLAINILYTVHVGGDINVILNPFENMPIDVLLRRISSLSNQQEIKTLLDSNSNHWEDVLYIYFDIITRSPVIKPDRRANLLEHISILDMINGMIKRNRAYFLMKYFSAILSWIVYQSNRWGAVYDGRIPEYRLYTYVLNKDIRVELEELLNKYGNRLHESKRKFFFESLLVAVLSNPKYENLLNWTLKIYGLDDKLKVVKKYGVSND
ncbi:MAG TPA: AAA family ATPase [Thermoprotei archaeon]|nr:AAA family ATPase [Thermoprotei archaeon]